MTKAELDGMQFYNDEARNRVLEVMRILGGSSRPMLRREILSRLSGSDWPSDPCMRARKLSEAIARARRAGLVRHKGGIGAFAYAYVLVEPA